MAAPALSNVANTNRMPSNFFMIKPPSTIDYSGPPPCEERSERRRTCPLLMIPNYNIPPGRKKS
jgi:hypothetical protein